MKVFDRKGSIKREGENACYYYILFVPQYSLKPSSLATVTLGLWGKG